MAALDCSPKSFTRIAISEPKASVLFRSFGGVPMGFLKKAHLGSERKRFYVSARFRKVKKCEYPWPNDPDPNVKGGVLTHLSHFKPLKEKPKSVTLDFEKPLLDLQGKIVEVQKMAIETGLNFSEQIIALENKYQKALTDLYTHLTPIQRVQLARHPNRPTFLDHMFNITEKFVELHGDRAGYDDPAVVTGLGTINGRTYMFIGQQKGRNTKENIHRNFGMPTPHGYRKALRMMKYADHHGFPIVTFIDTPGAYADLKSEEIGQGEAIAQNLRSMFGLKVPVLAIVIGEGGSGGALAIGCGNRLLMLENAVFYVASPEACAAILYKNPKAVAKASKKLRITSRELLRLKINDGTIPEPLGGAHTDPYWTSQQIKAAIVKHMDELVKMDPEALVKHRAHKFRKIGGYIDRPVDPKKKVNMKKREAPVVSSEPQLRDEVEKVKQQIIKSSGKKPAKGLRDVIEKLKKEIDYEYDRAAKSLGLKDKISKVREGVGRLSQGALKEKLEQLKHELDENLPKAPNYSTLVHKVNTLKELSSSETKLEINRRFGEILSNNKGLKQKIEALKGEIKGSDIESNHALKEKVKGELEAEFKRVLGSNGLQIVPLDTEKKRKIDLFYEEINTVIEKAVSSPGLKEKIEMLKAEMAKAAKDEKSANKIKALISEIKEGIKEAVNKRETNEKHEKVLAEVSKAATSSADDHELQVKVNAETNHGVV